MIRRILMMVVSLLLIPLSKTTMSGHLNESVSIPAIGGVVTLSDNGLELIKGHEGLRLEAYRDSANVLTVGWGHTGSVVEDMVITEDQAEFYLYQDTAHAQQAVNRLVKVPLSQNQFDALVSFTFNVGTHAFETSTTLLRLNRGDYEGAAEALLWWDKATVKGKKQKLAGLTKRRQKERTLFLTPDLPA